MGLLVSGLDVEWSALARKLVTKFQARKLVTKCLLFQAYCRPSLCMVGQECRVTSSRRGSSCRKAAGPSHGAGS